MAKFGIFEKIYAYEYNSFSQFRQLEIVRLENNAFFSYQNGKKYPLNHDKEFKKKKVGKIINSHFFDDNSYTIKKDNKEYALTPQSIVFDDCAFLISHLLGEKELQKIKSRFGFLFQEANPSVEEITKCQDFFDKNYNEKYKQEKYQSIFAGNDEYQSIAPPQISWYVVDYGKDHEK